MKKLLISLILALVLLFSMSSVALAADVEVHAVSNGGSGSDVTVAVTGIDTSTWNPGAVGQTNTFNAQGAFVADYSSSAGVYGSLNSLVNATGSAIFTLTDTQDFNILSANHNYNTTGVFTAVASGTNAEMNLDNHGSMYSWSEHTQPYWAPELQGTAISKNYNMFTGSILTSTMYIGATASNVAWLDNSSQWGFGSGETGTIGCVVDTVTAIGSGTYMQYIAGSSGASSDTSATVDGTGVVVSGSLPSGGAITTVLNFVTGMNSVYSMNAN